MNIKHIGIYMSNKTDKRLLIDKIQNKSFLENFIDISGKKGMLHSTIEIDKIIREEYLHDKYPIVTTNNASLESMSSGQQRKALLLYILEQKPEFIILDDILSSIDLNTQSELIDLLNEHKDEIAYIQIFFRKLDVLDIVEKVITLDADCKIDKVQSFDEFINNSDTDTDLQDIEIPDIYGDPIESPDPLIEMNNIRVSYEGKPVLNNINWTIRKGEFWQLRGPIGSGKSTILSMIIGDNPKAYGQDMKLFGIKKGSGESVWDIKKNIGYFYHKMTLRFSNSDTIENMIISGMMDQVGLRTKPTNLQTHIAKTWIKVLGSTFYGKRFDELSIGQQRIILVIRAIVKQPPLLILDEPTVGLDDHNAQLFINLIKALVASKKIAIIYVSHRDEPNLRPQKTMTLVPSATGSTGVIS